MQPRIIHLSDVKLFSIFFKSAMKKDLFDLNNRLLDNYYQVHFYFKPLLIIWFN